MSQTTDQPVTTGNLSRRELLGGAVATTVALASGVSLAAGEHSHHAANKNTALLDSALECLKQSQLCMDHCVEMMKTGDTSLAVCADLVNETMAMCTALSQMAAYRSEHLHDLARVCISVCEDCEQECRKHEQKHAECKACGDSCAACINECEQLIT